MISLARRLPFAILALCAAAFLVPAAAGAVVGPGYQRTTEPAAAAAGWLATQLEGTAGLPSPTGDHFEYAGGGYVDYGENADVIFGLAAARTGSGRAQAALSYLATNVDAYGDISAQEGGPYDGSLAKLAVAAIVAGTAPTAFGGYNLMQHLKVDECAAASAPYDQFGDQVCYADGSGENIFASVSESLILIAEARAGGAYAPSTHAVTYFDSLQCPSGGFTTEPTPCQPGDEDVDSTAYAIMAMQATGGQSAQLAAAETWLEGREQPGHYWVAQSVPNVNSTGLAVAALSGVGVTESAARAWLGSQQVASGMPGAGALRYGGTFTPTSVAGGASPSVLATAQALTGLEPDGSLATLTAAGSTNVIDLFAPTATVGTPSAKPGHRQTVTGHGFVAGEQVTAVLHSSPVTLGRAIAGADGVVVVSYGLPTSVAPGSHTMTLTGTTSGLAASSPLTVVAAATPTPTPTTTSSTSASASASTASAATPSTTDALADTGQDRARLVGVGLIGGLAVLLGAGLLTLGRRRSH